MNISEDIVIGVLCIIAALFTSVTVYSAVVLMVCGVFFIVADLDPQVNI